LSLRDQEFKRFKKMLCHTLHRIFEKFLKIVIDKTPMKNDYRLDVELMSKLRLLTYFEDSNFFGAPKNTCEWWIHLRNAKNIVNEKN